MFDTAWRDCHTSGITCEGVGVVVKCLAYLSVDPRTAVFMVAGSNPGALRFKKKKKTTLVVVLILKIEIGV